jgi:cyclopropane fatty-acyl-phospholipid synthase-like methyltransferase
MESKILEIGCGWGGFAEYLGKNYDVKLDCITISQRNNLNMPKKEFTIAALMKKLALK